MTFFWREIGKKCRSQLPKVAWALSDLLRVGGLGFGDLAPLKASLTEKKERFFFGAKNTEKVLRLMCKRWDRKSS